MLFSTFVWNFPKWDKLWDQRHSGKPALFLRSLLPLTKGASFLFCFGVFWRHLVLCILWMEKLSDFGRGFCSCSNNLNQILTAGSMQHWLFLWRKQELNLPLLRQKTFCTVTDAIAQNPKIWGVIKEYYLISSRVVFSLQLIHELRLHKICCSVFFKSLFNCTIDSF